MKVVKVTYDINKMRLSGSTLSGDNLVTYLRLQGYTLTTPCGGNGVCGKCRVRILEGEDTLNMPYTDLKGITLQEWEQGYRLACKTIVKEDLQVELPDNLDALANIMTAGDYDVALQTRVKKVYIQMPNPSIEDQTSDVDRIEKALYPAKINNLSLVGKLPVVLQGSDYKVTAVIQRDEIIAIEGGDTQNQKYGVAIDIGTTTMVGVVIDLNTGEQVGIYSSLNPQKAYGADVISRIGYTIENKGGLKVLKDIITDEINAMLLFFNRQYGISLGNIYHINVVGNTIMLHLFTGVSVKSIASSPFAPAMSHFPAISAKELGLNICPDGIITSLPMIAGYIGADTVGCILACDMIEDTKISLMIDIGTNGEIALGNKDRIVACATAAGPALEGGHIQCGIGGVQGAVNKIKIHDKGIEYTTIWDQPPLGVCGSGVVDVVAQMLEKGLVESYGRMLSAEEAMDTLPREIASRVGDFGGKPCLMLVSKDEGAVEDIFITQKDIREIQLAKAAIAAGIRILMQELNIDYKEIDNVYLAGGFGNYIDHSNAMKIGLIPIALKGKVIPIGNAALTGAKMIVKSYDYMETAEKIRRMTKYIELSTRMDFQDIFVDNMEF